MRATFRPPTEFKSPLVAHRDVEGGLLRAPGNIDADPQAVLRPEEEASPDAAGDDPALLIELRHISPVRAGTIETATPYSVA